MKVAVSGILVAGSMDPSICYKAPSESTQEAIIKRAAFDIGSGESRVTVGEVDINHNRIHHIWLQTAKRVELIRDLATSEEKNLSPKIQKELIDTIMELKERVNNLCIVDQWSAIGTSVFRVAANGQEFLQKVEEETGIKIVLLPQEEEGKVGFSSAVAMSKKTPEEVISWDSGSGSFQITAMNQGEMNVYGTEFALIPVLKALSNIRKATFDPEASPYPITQDETKQLKEYIQSQLPTVPEWLNQTDKQVVGIGRFCIFSIGAQLIGKDTFTREEVEELINSKLEEDFKELDIPAYGMPGLILLHSVMEHCNINQVTFCKTNGSAEGVLITPYLWE